VDFHIETNLSSARHAARTGWARGSRPLASWFLSETSSGLSDRYHLEGLPGFRAGGRGKRNDQPALAAPALEFDGPLDHAGQQAPAQAAAIHLLVRGRTAGDDGRLTHDGNQF
jgi:hypothetical protein